MELRAELYSKIKHQSTLLNFIIFCAVKYIWESFEAINKWIDEMIALLKQLPSRLSGQLQLA